MKCINNHEQNIAIGQTLLDPIRHMSKPSPLKLKRLCFDDSMKPSKLCTYIPWI